MKMKFYAKFSINIPLYNDRTKEDCDCIKSRTLLFGCTKNVFCYFVNVESRRHFACLNFVYNNNYMAAIKVVLCIMHHWHIFFKKVYYNYIIFYKSKKVSIERQTASTLKFDIPAAVSVAN